MTGLPQVSSDMLSPTSKHNLFTKYFQRMTTVWALAGSPQVTAMSEAGWNQQPPTLTDWGSQHHCGG